MKKKLASISLFAFLLIVLTFGLSSKDLKIDKTVIVDKLDNGFSYYIKENDFHDKKASLRLLVKVGSAVETEEERGIAHFLEHMVFRGSENFKDYEVIKYLESIGAEFGPDTNAYTSFDKTCYMLEVPLKNEKDLDKAILFLSEFAFRAKLDADKIDIERAIVLDELRKSSGPNLRIMDKHFSVILKGTSYENRLPIGKEEVILNSSPDVIKNFYKKWYTPKNMALMAVGDFDKNEVKKQIEKHFSTENFEKENEPNYVVNKTSATDFSIVRDPEVSTTSIELMSISNPKLCNSKEDIKEGLIFNIIYDVLNQRFHEIASQNDAKFISAAAYEGSFITNLNLKGIGVTCWENKHLEGLETALMGLKKIKDTGVLSDELTRAIKGRKEALKKAISNIDKTENTEFIQAYFDHFIYKEKIFSKESVLKLEEKLLDTLSLDDINARLVDFFSNKDWLFIATLPEAIKLSQDEITNTLKGIESREMIQEEAIVLNEDDLIVPTLEIEGKIAKIERDEKAEITEVQFENGIKLFLTKTDLKKDEIVIRSYALKGMANLDSSLLDTAKLATGYFYDSGIAGIDKSSFSKLLDLKNSTLNVSLALNTRNISANTNNDNFEDIVKLINRIFTSKNYQDDLWGKTQKIAKESQKASNLNPDSIFYKTANSIFTSKNKMFADVNFDDIELEDAKKIIDTFFSNPKDFTFFIVGDFDEEKVISTLEKYLGSIATDKKMELDLKPLKNIEFPEENETHIVNAGTENKSACFCGFDLEKINASDEKDWAKLELMRPIITQRLFQVLRLENAKTYSPQNFVSYYLYPDLTNFNYFIHFTGPVEAIDSIKDMTLKTMQNMQENGPTQEELSSAKEIVKNDVKENLKYNNFVASSNMSSHMQCLNIDKDFKELLILDENEIVDSITLQDMQSFMKKLFSKDKVSSVIWLPKEK